VTWRVFIVSDLLTILDWAAYFLDQSPEAYATYTPYLWPFYNALNTVKSWILPIIDQISHKPDLATIALLLVIVLVSLKILDMLWQTVIFWFKLAKRILFWGGLAALGLWLWSRGPEGMMQDVQYWQEAWSSEYGYWKEQEKMARMSRQGINHRASQQPGRAGWFGR